MVSRVNGPNFYGSGWTASAVLVEYLQSNAIENEIKKNLEEWGDEILKMFSDHIDRQDLPWAPLSESTLYIKAKKGQPLNIYEATGSYKKGINKSVKEIGEQVFSLEIFPDGIHSPSGLSMANLAFILEYGNEEKPRIPERPIWRAIITEIPTTEGYRKFRDSITHIGFME